MSDRLKRRIAQAGLTRTRMDRALAPLHKLQRVLYGLDVQKLRRLQRQLDEQHVDLLSQTNAHLRSELRQRFLPEPEAYPTGDCVYVLATGPSLSQITEQEKQVIRGALSVGMNRYVLFWEKLGIWPDFFFLGDKYVAAPSIFVEACNVIVGQDRPITLLVDGFFRAAAPVTRPAIFFDRWHVDTDEARWATARDEKLFFWRGSLTCLVNLLCVLRVAPKIKLVGVDLNRPGSYFATEVQQRPDLEDPQNLEAARLGIHSTAMRGVKGEAGIEAKWPYIQQSAKAMGIEIVCCNPDSLLVQAGVCPYEPIVT